MQATTTKHHGNLSILDRIVAAKRTRIAADKLIGSEATMIGAAEEANRKEMAIDFHHAIGSSSSVSVIAEMKRSSPSAGVMDMSLDPAKRSETYCRAGAVCDLSPHRTGFLPRFVERPRTRY